MNQSVIEICKKCNGSGVTQNPGAMVNCDVCNGSGRVVVTTMPFDKSMLVPPQAAPAPPKKVVKKPPVTKKK